MRQLPRCLAAVFLIQSLFGQAEPPSWDSTASRWLEVLEANPANSHALGQLLASSAPEAWPEIARRLESLTGSEARLALADFYFRTGSPAAPSLLAVEPTQLSQESLMRLGSLWTAVGEPGRARAAWELAASRQPQDQRLLFQLAAASQAAGDNSTAAKFYQQVAESAASSLRLEALEKLSDLREKLGEPDAALQAALDAFEMLGPTHWKFPVLAERVLGLAESQNRLEEIGERWSSGADPASLRRRATWLSRRGRHSEAAEALCGLAKKMPSEPSLAAEWGAAELAAGEPARAVEAMQAAFRLDPSPSRAFALAEALALAGRENEAATVIFQNVQPPSAQAEMFQTLGLQSGLELALRAAADNPLGQRAFIEFLLERGRDEEAQKIIESLPPLEAARLLQSKLRLAAAEKFARLAAAQNDEKAWLLLADILEARGVSAVSDLTRAVENHYSPALERRLFDAISREEPDAAAARVRLRREGERRWEAARLAQNPEAWMRAAKWYEGMNESTVVLLEEATTHFPENHELWEELARAKEAQGDLEGALAALEATRRLQPSPAIDRELARLERLRGNAEAASAILLHLAEENPTDFSLARDLAEAREAENNVFDALAWWEKAFALAPPQERAPLIRPTLACFARLGLTPRALNFLENAGPKLPEGPHRREWAQAAANFAQEQGVLDEWTRRCQSRAAHSPAAFLALRELGKNTESTHNQGLKESLEKAIAASDWPTALALSRKLASSPQASWEDHVRWAKILEKSGDFQTAASQWEFLTSRFGRHQPVLLEAAEFFERHTDIPAARNLQKKASRLGPLPASVVFSIAGELPVAEAARLLEDLVRRLPEETSQGRLPRPLRLEKIPGPSPQLRDLALRELGRLRFHTRNQLENIAGRGTLGLIWALSAAREPCAHEALAFAETYPEQFIELALEEQNYDLLLQWLQGQLLPGERWKEIVEATGPLLAHGWRPEPSAFVSFFRKAPAFAQRDMLGAAIATGHFRLATQLGVPEGLPREEESQARLAVAISHLRLPEIDKAMAVLAKMPEPSSSSLVDPYFEALRIRLLLLYPQPVGIPRLPPALALAAAIHQHQDTFREAVRDWLPSIQPLREAGQLHKWNLTEAAEELLALAWDRNRERSFFDALASLRISRARASQAGPWTHQWLALGTEPENVLACAARASALGNQETSAAILEAFLVRFSESEAAWSQLATLEWPLSPRIRSLWPSAAQSLSEGLKQTLSQKMNPSEKSSAIPSADESQASVSNPLADSEAENEESIRQFLAAAPSPDSLERKAKLLPQKEPALVRQLPRPLASRFFPRPLSPKFLRTEVSWAKLREELDSLEKDWRERAKRGERLGWEGLVLIDLARNADPLPSLEKFYESAEPSPSTLSSLAQELQAGEHWEACRWVLQKLEASGFPSPDLLVSWARLHPEPNRKKELFELLARLARWDPVLRQHLIKTFPELGVSEEFRSLPTMPSAQITEK